MTRQTSTTLLAGLAEPRNEAAWRRFYALYAPMLLSYSRRVGLSDADAQDVAAETLAVFVQAYRAGRYDRQRARLKSWLGGIAQNKVRKLREVRQLASLNAVRADGSSALEPAAPIDETKAFENEWRLTRLEEAQAVLRAESDPQTYQAFDLYAVKNWPVAKVAEFLGISANVVYISKTRCVQRLRAIIADLEADEC